jgi:hypothetical protein
LGGHFQATSERFADSDGPIPILQDTMIFPYQREQPERIGFTGKSGTRKVDGRNRPLTQCGILMHSSLAITTEGVPLSLAAIKFWTRKKFKDFNALKKKINLTLLYCARCQYAFPCPTCVDRLAGDGTHTALVHFKVQGDDSPTPARLCCYFLTTNGVWACGGQHAV